MLYNDYRVYYYQNSRTGKVPVLEYFGALLVKDKGKISAYIVLLRNCGGRLDEPYSRYTGSGVRELRVEFSRNRHRIFYVTVEGKKIILLHAFLKKTPKTPEQEIKRALNNFEDYRINKKLVDYEKEE